MQQEDRISITRRVKTFMSIENADPSLALLGLVPQKHLRINSFFGLSIDGKSYGVRMHPLFPVRLLEFFTPQGVDPEKGMVRQEEWPLIHEIFTQLCNESFTLESWFPCPAPIRVYGEDIRCFKLMAVSRRKFDPSIRPLTKNLLSRNEVKMEDVLRNIECQRLGWQGNRASALVELLGLYLSDSQGMGLAGSLYVRVIASGPSIRLYSSLLMTEHHADDLRDGFQRWLKTSNHRDHKSMFITEDFGSPVSGGTLDEPVYVFDFIHAGGSIIFPGEEGAMLKEIKSFVYRPEDMNDLEKVEGMPAKPSDFLKYLRFVQFDRGSFQEYAEPVGKAESVCGAKRKERDINTGMDKENVFIQQV